MPASLRLEPMRFATGNAVDLIAGGTLPETSVSVINGGGQKVVRSVLCGKKQNFTIVQRLWRLNTQSGRAAVAIIAAIP